MISAITFLFCLFLGRAFYVQVIWRETLVLRALDQWTREVPVVAQRGRIFDRNGELLAGNVATYSVFARANAVQDAEGSARVLSALLPVSYEEALAKLTNHTRSEVTLVRQAEKSVVERIAGSGLSGVYYARDNRRFYPYGALACRLIGFTAEGQTGVTGLERYYDGYLAGKAGELVIQTDLVGVQLAGTGASYLPATDGLDVTLTVDSRIQALAERVMQDAMLEHGAAGVTCVVIDPQDFSIYAMVDLPSYDLNEVPRDDLDALNRLSRSTIVSDAYEPGSTFKIVTAAANLEEHLGGNARAFSPSYIFSSARTRSVDGGSIRCWSDHANGKHSHQTLAMALNNSCNPCFVDIALSLGRETFYDYLEAFGFGRVTGVDFSGEAAGLVIGELAVREGDLARIGFGQAIAVTPLQLACAAASAVNGGYYYTPRLLECIRSADGAVSVRGERSLVRRTVSEETSALLSAMLEGVVAEGSGKKAYIEGYRVAGKTGTAQKYENGAVAQGKYVSSFVGYFPAHEPKYLALVTVDEPQGAYYGSVVAAPCAGQIFEGIIRIMQIPPYTASAS